MLSTNEWVEILISLSGGKWHAGDCSGEALLHYCGIIRFQAGQYTYYGSWVDQWLNKQPPRSSGRRSETSELGSS
jgi:hypothetical protein